MLRNLLAVSWPPPSLAHGTKHRSPFLVCRGGSSSACYCCWCIWATSSRAFAGIEGRAVCTKSPCCISLTAWVEEADRVGGERGVKLLEQLHSWPPSAVGMVFKSSCLCGNGFHAQVIGFASVKWQLRCFLPVTPHCLVASSSSRCINGLKEELSFNFQDY